MIFSSMLAAILIFSSMIFSSILSLSIHALSDVLDVFTSFSTSSLYCLALLMYCLACFLRFIDPSLNTSVFSLTACILFF